MKNRTEITDAITEWLYEHTSGNISVVVSLIHDAQEIAILNGKEVLNLELLNEAYQQRLSMLHGFIQPSIPQVKQTSKVKKRTPVTVSKNKDNNSVGEHIRICELVVRAKDEGTDIIQLLREHMSIVEVAI